MYHESDSEWTEENDVCKTYKCNNGVITESLTCSCNDPKITLSVKYASCCSSCTGMSSRIILIDFFQLKMSSF